MRRTVLGVLSSLVAVMVVTVVPASAPPAAAADDVRHYVDRAGDQLEVTCSGTTCTFDASAGSRFADPAFEAFEGPITVTGGSATLTAPPRCKDGDSHGKLTLQVTLTDELLGATWRQAKGERRGAVLCFWNATERQFLAKRLAVELQDAGDETGDEGDEAGDEGVADPDSRTGSASAGASSPTSSSTGETSVSRLDSGAVDAPSVLSALQRPGDVDAGRAAMGILVAIILVLLVAFPTTLLNSAAEEGSDRISAWWRGRRGLPDPGDAVDPRWWLAAGGVFVAGVISCFVDPGFGFNAGSVRTLLSVLASFAVDVLVGWAVTIWAVRRLAPTVTTSYTFKPLTLVLVVGAVAFTRLTGFEPGIIFGLVAGVGFGALLDRGLEARATLVALGYGAGVGLLAWLGYGALGTPEGALSTFASETLAATAIAGLAALPITLFPVPGLPGHTVFAWHRLRWAVCYAGGLAAFFLVLMPTPYAWDEIDWSLRAWVLAYLGYLAAAVVAWVLVRRSRSDDPAHPGGGDDGDEADEDRLAASGQP